MKINVKKVLAEGHEKANKVKPLPKVVIGTSVKSPVVKIPVIEVPVKVLPKMQVIDDKAMLLNDLWEQMHVIKAERGKLASATATLVDETSQKLIAEGPAIEAEFWKGNIAVPELAEHYAQLQMWIEKGAEVYSQIKHVELYGSLPAPKPVGELVGAGKTLDAKALSADIRALDKLISKTNKKMISGLKPKNNGRVQVWKEKIERAKIQREDLKRKLNAIQYEARAQRTGE
jgi:hypothetical protein